MTPAPGTNLIAGVAMCLEKHSGWLYVMIIFMIFSNLHHIIFKLSILYAHQIDWTIEEAA